MPRSGPRTVRKYSDEFKRTAVRLSQQAGIQVKSVAAALEIHPFMLSKWRKDARDVRLRGRAPKAPPPGPAREIARPCCIWMPVQETAERGYDTSCLVCCRCQLDTTSRISTGSIQR